LSLIAVVKNANVSDNAMSVVYHCILINVDNAALGGEPSLRKDLSAIINSISLINGIEK